MKKSLITFLLLLITMLVYGQQKIIIHLTDGNTIEKEIWEVDKITFGESTPADVVKPTTNSAVDLGLSIKWADSNLVDAVTNSTLLVGWADPTGNIKSEELRFYPSDTDAPVDIIGSKMDIVTSLWGTGWRLPSDEEFQELIDKCTWTWNAGKNGYDVKGPNGNSIFLPVTGFRFGSASPTKTDKGYYWTGIRDQYQKYAKSFYFTASPDSQRVDSMMRYYGLAVRPVYGPYYHISFDNIKVSDVTISSVDVSVTFNGTPNAYEKFVLRYSENKDFKDDVDSVVITNDNLTNNAYTFKLIGLKYNTQYYYQISALLQNRWKKSDIGKFHTTYTHMDFSVADADVVYRNSANINVKFSGTFEKYGDLGLVYSKNSNLSDSTVVTITSKELDADGNYTFSLNNLDYNTVYYYKAFAKGASAEAKDEGSDPKSFQTETKYTAVAQDLDLPSGLKWATYNLGAKRDAEYGPYKCWADPDEKSTSQADYTSLVEFEPQDIGGTEYDVATKTLGGLWHIPDSVDFMELRNNCDWEYATLTDENNNTISGYYVKSKKDPSKKIFLPHSGNVQGDGKTIYSKGTVGFYWTSRNHSGLYADYFTFSTSPEIAAHVGYNNKYLGMAIRPVYGEVTSQRVTVIDSTQISKYDNVAVDLGLSVAWASHDFGAESDAQAGAQVAWGELASKESYTMDNYNYIAKDGEGTNVNGYRFIGNSISGNKEYDPVAAQWGGNWRMPTTLEFRELLEDCDWSWDASTGSYTITSKINNKSIRWIVGSSGRTYWLGDLYTNKSDNLYNTSAYYFDMNPNSKDNNDKVGYPIYGFRYFAKYIRPVKEPYNPNNNKK